MARQCQQKSRHLCCDHCAVTAKEENIGHSVPREKGCSQALSEEKTVLGIKAGRFNSTISMMHRNTTWKTKWQLQQTRLLFKQPVLVQNAHLRALQPLMKTEVVQGSRENHRSKPKEQKNPLVPNSLLISCIRCSPFSQKSSS